MRLAFAGCVAFAALAAFVALRFGSSPSPAALAPVLIVDAAIDAPAVVMVPDAAIVVVAPPGKKPVRKKPARPGSKPVPTPVVPVPTPVVPVPVPVVPSVPVVPTPATPGRCVPPPNPAGCPATEPNINRPCDADGVRCVYGPSCCPPVYVCNEGAFEAWFTSCP